LPVAFFILSFIPYVFSRDLLNIYTWRTKKSC